MTSIFTPADLTAARQARARARARAIRTETDCSDQNGRADLLLNAARARFASGDIDVARDHVERLLARADHDPDYAPLWLVGRAKEMLALFERYENGDAAPI